MKATYNKLPVIVILGLIFAISPATQVFAIMGEGNNNENQNTTLQTTIRNACTKAISMSTTSNATVLAHVANMKTDFANRLTSIDSKQAEVKQKIYTKRAEITERFQLRIDDLKAIEGLTEEQIAAIDTYSTNITDAKSIRDTAIDQALNKYQLALKETIQKHQDDLLTATTTFENSVANAFNEVRESCTSGTDISDLKSSIREARQKLVTTRQSTEYKNMVRQLQDIRNEEIKEANDAFKKLAVEYKTTLLKTLSLDSDTESTQE